MAGGGYGQLGVGPSWFEAGLRAGSMSILNVLVSHDQLVITVDTLAEDVLTGAHSAGAKMLLIPQHNLLLATRGAAQFLLRIYELALKASFRADFTMEQLTAETGLVIDHLGRTTGRPSGRRVCRLSSWARKWHWAIGHRGMVA